MHLVSVIIPIYSIEKYLPRCLDSVINQTYGNLEIIIIDDGSTDNSYAVANEYAQRDERIRVLQTEHMGITKIRKKGIREAAGKYLAFVDGDDWIEAECIETWVRNIGKADMLLSGYITEPEGHIYQQPFDEGYYSAGGMVTIRERLFGTATTVSAEELISENLWNNLYTTQLMKDIIDYVPDRLCVGEDRVMVSLAVLASEAVYVKNIAAYHYCIRKNSLSRGKIPSILMDIALIYDCLRGVIEKHSERERLLPALCRYICQGMIYDGDLPRCLGYLECREWYYPYYGRLQGKRIILYGAGEVGKSFYRQIKRHKESIMVAWVDKEYEKYNVIEDTVFPVWEINHLEFDFIIIAVYNENTAEEITHELENMGVMRNQMLWNRTHV